MHVMRICGYVVFLLLLALFLFPSTPSLAGGDSFFDVWYESSVPTGPPYPNAGFQGAVGHSGGGSYVTDGYFTIKMEDCMVVSTSAQIFTYMTGVDTAPGTGQGDFSVDSFFDIFYDGAADTSGTSCEFCVDSFFDVSLRYDDPTTGGPAALADLNAAYPPGDTRRYFDTWFVDSFFDITYEVSFSGGMNHQVTIHGTVPSELRLTNVSVGLRNPGSVDSFFDIFIDISPVAPMQPGTSALTLRQTGLFSTPPVATDGTSWGAVKSLFR